jgi:alanine-glyoxylate transaminase / serine-glyoxylate transaminase / serine-pyruvate transaminase
VATVAGVEMGLKLHGVPIAASGTQALMDHFAAHPQPKVLRAAA